MINAEPNAIRKVYEKQQIHKNKNHIDEIPNFNSCLLLIRLKQEQIKVLKVTFNSTSQSTNSQYPNEKEKHKYRINHLIR